jgi:PAS domain S-box-containing protein
VTMKPGIRKSGIDIAGDIPWGTHFALFYRTKEDLIDILVPYFMSGLENNEYCLWVTAEPLEAGEARAKMAAVVPDFDRYVKKGQIEIIPYTDWYTIDGKFDGERVLDGWIGRLSQARANGFDGLRLTGNESWLDRETWNDFIGYEKTINQVIGHYNMLAVCSYHEGHCDASDILDVVNTHQFALNRRDGRWKIIEDQEQKRTRKALRDSETSLAKSQEMAHIGSWELDVATGEIERSAESYRIFGLAPDEYMITYEKFLGFVLPEEREHVAREIRSAAEIGQPYDATFRIRRKDGEIRVLHSMAEPLGNKSGRIVRLFGTNQDITERKRTEEELKAAKAQAELYLDLMGHDINNMHQIALGYLEMARDMHAGGELKEFIDKPMEVLQRSTRLIENVRKLQKLHEGALPASVVDLAGLLADVQREFGSVPCKAVTLDMNGCDCCRVQANELLYDVFANLVTNALKHTGERAEIRIGLERLTEDGRHVCRATVEDDGPGIPDEFKGRIFNRLLKGTEKAKGMGLGLYLVKSLVESYGGLVWVEDRAKGDHTKGAKFVVMLPAFMENETD